MDIELDTEKDAANLEKHGITLVLGAVILANRMGKIPDQRRDYDGTRINVFGYVADRLFVCTYTSRGNAVRMISVRKPSEQEQRRWQP